MLWSRLKSLWQSSWGIFIKSPDSHPLLQYRPAVYLGKKKLLMNKKQAPNVKSGA